MEKIQLENQAVYWAGDVISLAEKDLKKVVDLSEEICAETNSLLYSQKYLMVCFGTFSIMSEI